MGAIDGKVAVVTGAAGASGGPRPRSSPGRAPAWWSPTSTRRAAARPWPDRGHRRAGDLRPTDVSVKADVAAMVRHAVETYGGLDCAHNNAGIAAPMAPLADYPDDGWDRTIGRDADRRLPCMKAEIPAMLERGGGRHRQHRVGRRARRLPGQAAYTASKHGVIGLTKVAALDYGAQGIRVNAICPGTARTPMVDRAVRHDPSFDAYLTSLHPIGRIGEASEIAEAAVWLCTPAASFVLGAALPVDGGYVIA